MQKWKWLREVENWYWRAFVGANVAYALLVIGSYYTKSELTERIFDFEVSVFTVMFLGTIGLFLTALQERIERKLETVTSAPLWLRIVVWVFLAGLGVTTIYSARVGSQAQALFAGTVLWALLAVCLLAYIRNNLKILNPYPPERSYSSLWNLGLLESALSLVKN